MSSVIGVGSYVRSFDFPETHLGRALEGGRACYVEGRVTAIARELHGCDRYVIAVERDVWCGAENQTRVGLTVNPPVNGTMGALRGVADGVELIERSDGAAP